MLKSYNKTAVIILLFLFSSAIAYPQLKIVKGGDIAIGTNTTHPQTKLTIRSDFERPLTLITHHDKSWFQSMTSICRDQYTTNYVVNWNKLDRFWVLGNGSIYARGAYFWSDRTLKEDIRPLDPALPLLSQLRPVTFHFARFEEETKSEERPLQMGFIAQEVEEVLPDLVSTIPSGLKALNYTALIPLLTKSIQEINAQNQDLSQRLQQLEDRLSASEAENTQLRQALPKRISRKLSH